MSVELPAGRSVLVVIDEPTLGNEFDHFVHVGESLGATGTDDAKVWFFLLTALASAASIWPICGEFHMQWHSFMPADPDEPIHPVMQAWQ